MGKIILDKNKKQGKIYVEMKNIKKERR